MYYHTSSELGIEATNRLQLQNDNILKNTYSMDNCGKMSLNDQLRESHLTEKRVMNFINELYSKFTRTGLDSLVPDSLVPISFISKSLNIPEELIMIILQKNRLELITTVEDED